MRMRNTGLPKAMEVQSAAHDLVAMNLQSMHSVHGKRQRKRRPRQMGNAHAYHQRLRIGAAFLPADRSVYSAAGSHADQLGSPDRHRAIWI